MKIGIYDSGIGGLFLLFSLYKRYPNHHYIYLGDQINAPYGTKDKTDLLNIARNNIEWFKSNDVNNIIVACNTLCSSGVFDLNIDDVNLYGIIEPTINQIELDLSSKILLLATPLTIKNGVYQSLLKIKGYTNIKAIALSELASMIEAGESEEKLLNYLQSELSMLDFIPDCIVLGCTHYPYVKRQLANLFDTIIYDSNDLNFDFGDNEASKLDIYTTSDSKVMEKQIKDIFNIDVKVRKI